MISDVLSIRPNFLAEPIIMAYVLTIFKESLLLCSHFSRHVSYALTTVLISSMLLEENDIVVSSAYIANCALLRASGSSFM